MRPFDKHPCIFIAYAKQNQCGHQRPWLTYLARLCQNKAIHRHLLAGHCSTGPEYYCNVYIQGYREITCNMLEVISQDSSQLIVLSFYTPVWKTGRIMPWQCLSVCPSVRPRFPDFSSTCFEISIWNLVYTFSRWHNMSSLSCITIGSLWPSLQPKVGQTYFLQSWPHKSR